MKKILLMCSLLCLVGCANHPIKTDKMPKVTPKIQITQRKNIEFLGIKNNSLLANEFGYSYFTESIAETFENQKLMLNKTGYLVDNVNLQSLKIYETNNRYLVFGEIKTFSTDLEENKEDVHWYEHAVYGLYTLGVGNIVSEIYANTNRLTTLTFHLEANFYLYDKQTERVIKKIPVSLDDKSVLPGSWNDTDEKEQRKITRNYFTTVTNKIGEQLAKEL